MGTAIFMQFSDTLNPWLDF